MNPKEFTHAWGLFTAGSELSEEEILAMERLMETDSVLRAEVAEDHQLHQLIRSMGPIHESQEDFVEGVLAACAGVDNPLAPLMDEEEPAAATWNLWRYVPALCIGAIAAAALLVPFLSSKLERAEAEAGRAMEMAAEARQQAEATAELIAQQARAAEEIAQVAVAEEKKEEPAVEEPKPTVVAGAGGESLAVLTGDSPLALWRGNIQNNRSLSAGDYELTTGEAILRMSGGSILSLRGPARFRLHHATHVTLHQGDVEVQVALDDVGFRLSTPNSRVIDLGTKFRVSVNDKGRTHVQLDVGEVVVMPWQSGWSEWRNYLRLNEFEEVVVHGPGDGVDGPLASYSSGPAGFKGAVRLGETAFDIGSKERFDLVFRAISNSYRSDSAKTRAAWVRAQKVLERVSGEVTVEDETESFTDLDGLLKIEKRMIHAGDLSQRLSSTSVTGSITVMGKQHKFRTLRQYDQVRARIFEALSALGIGTFSEMQRQLDTETDPFRDRKSKHDIR